MLWAGMVRSTCLWASHLDLNKKTVAAKNYGYFINCITDYDELHGWELFDP